jgi:hypothetical protein
MLELAALAAVVVPGLAATVVWGRRASAALVAVVARAAPGLMRAASPTARLVVMPGRVVLVERVALLARLARTPRRCSAVLAVSAVTLARRARVLRAPVVSMEHRRCVTADLVAWVELAALAAMLVPAALAAVVVPGRVATVVWVRRASAALVAMAVLAAPGSMRAA